MTETAGTGRIGDSVARKEDRRFITGGGAFVDDFHIENLAHAAILRSPHPHAKILGVDASAAREMPGIIDVFSFADIADMAKPIPLRLAPIPGFEKYLQLPLAGDKTRFVGEPVAVIVAEDRYVAEDALAAIEVDYAPLPPVATTEAAMRDEVLVHDGAGSNLACDYTVSHGDTESAFLNAPYTRSERFYCHRHGAVPLETRGLVAGYDAAAEKLTLWGATKVNFHNRRLLAGLLDIAEDQIEVVELDVGGGFGARGEFYPEDYLIPLAAIRLGRPVKWIEDRREHLISANQSREIACVLEIACEADGALRGMRAHLRADMGAHLRTNGGVVPAKTVQSLPGPYRLPAFDCAVEAVVTTKTPVGTYRAPGRFEATFFRERLFDMAAADLGIDPGEFRRRNALTDAEMPYNIGHLIPYDAGPAEYDIGDVEPLLDRAIEEIGGTDPKQQDDGRLYGVGVACCVDSTGVGPAEVARINLKPDGAADVYVGCSTMGQGQETTFAQICVDELGLAYDDVTVHRTGTIHLDNGYGTYNSRAIVMGGGALTLAADDIRKQLVQAAGMRLNLAEDELDYRDGAVWRAGDDGPDAAPLMDVPDMMAARKALGLGDDDQDGDPDTLDVTATFEQRTPTHTYGAHAARIAIDPETGGIEILDYAAVEDIGRMVNPMIVHGQSIGATVQGLGGALLEQFVYDDDAQPLSANFADYMLPSSLDVPHIAAVTLENSPSAFNPLGVKGAGEGGIVATAAVVANAVCHALAKHGVQITELPLSPARLRAQIEAAKVD